MTDKKLPLNFRFIPIVLMPAIALLTILACATTPLTDMPMFACPSPPPPTVGYRTLVPLPPTPYIIRPPQDFYRGDAVYVGVRGSANRVRFRLQTVYVLPSTTPITGTPRGLYVWSLEIRNLGTVDYQTVPVAQMVISRIQTSSGEIDGIWRTSDSAMHEAGITGEMYDPLPPLATRIYRMAAYGPIGSPRRFIFILDDETNNTITWINQANPLCIGDIAD